MLIKKSDPTVPTSSKEIVDFTIERHRQLDLVVLSVPGFDEDIGLNEEDMD